MPVRIYDKWRQGSSGFNPDGEYNSRNAQVYEDGTLGPRPGWKLISQTAGTKVHDISNSDYPIGFTWYRETDDAEGLLLYFWDDSASVRKYDIFPLATQTWAAGGTLNLVSGAGISWHPNGYDDNQKIQTWNDGFLLTAMGPYLAVASSSSPGTFTAPTIAAGSPRAVTIYRDRAYYWGISAYPGRVYYSDAADYSTVQSTSFFEVNSSPDQFAGAVTGMWNVKNALVIARKDDTWLVLTGTSPENGTLRELGRDQVPDFLASAIVDNEVYFVDRTGGGVIVATPSFIDGQSLAHVAPTAYSGSLLVRPTNGWFPQTAVGDEITRSLFLPARLGGDSDLITAAERVNDVWNLSLWTYEDDDPGDILFTGGRPNELYACVSDDTASLYLYSRNHTLNRPANSGDTKSKALGLEDGPASAPSAQVDLGEVTAAEGKVIRPTKVVFDVGYWKGGNYSDPSLSVVGFITGTETNDPPLDTLATQTVTTTAWGDSFLNFPYRRRVPVVLPQGQFGTSFFIRIQFDNLALESVQVYYEEQDDPR